MAETIATFEDALAATGLPAEAVAPIREKWNEAFSLISKNNERVAQVNAAKAQDPNNLEYIDSLWKSHYASDPKMVETEAKFQAVTAEYERLLAELRDFGKTKVQPPLSEEDSKKVRQAVNESEPAIKTARASAAAMVAIVDSMLAVHGKQIEGGVISLMPEADSLKSLRGRKATSGSTASYATRIGGFEIDGRNIQRDGKSNFRYGADSVSSVFGADKFPENKVTGEEIEEAFFKAIGKPFRSVKSTELPESTTFDFTKEIKLDENKTGTKTVKITIKRKVEETVSTEAKPAEESKTEVPAAKVAAPATSAPAKKAEPAAKK